MDEMIERRAREQGSALAVALIMVVLLALIGVTVSTTTDREIKIAGNEQDYIHEFYVADSAWRQGVQWLNTRATVPSLANKAMFDEVITAGIENVAESDAENYLNVRNYGAGVDQQLNDDFSEGSQDGTLGTGPHTFHYWYQVAFNDQADMAGEPIPFSSPEYRRYRFNVISVAGNQNPRKIRVTTSKVFKTGY